MSATLLKTPRRTLAGPWVIVLLLFLAQVINFFDKSVIGLAAIPMMAELGLSPRQYGLIASSFYSLYAVSGIVVGLLFANRLSPKWLLVVLVLVWSIAQMPIVLTSAVPVLVGSRILLGIGEGPATPTSYNACLSWFPADKRNLPMAFLSLGSAIGTLIGAPTLIFFIAQFGWRSAFLVCGALGFLWIALWTLLGADGPYGAASLVEDRPIPQHPAEHPPTFAFWTDPTVVASLAVGFCAYWIVGFSVAWLPIYFQRGLGYAPQTTGWLVSAFSTAGGVLSLVLAWLSQRMLRAGWSSRVSRGAVNGSALLVGALLVAGSVLLEGGALKLIMVAVGLALPLVTFTIGPTIVAEVAPPAESRRAVLMVYSAITLAGFLSPLAAAQLISLGGADPFIGYDYALLGNAAILLAGGAAGVAFLRPEATIRKLAGAASTERRG